MSTAKLLQVLLSLGLACVLGLAKADPYVEPEYGAASPFYQSEQSHNTNYAQTLYSGAHYGDDYMALGSRQTRQYRRPPGPGPKPRREKDEYLTANRHGPPYPEDNHHAADQSGWGPPKPRGWGNTKVEKIEKVVVHHFHGKPKRKKRPGIPRLKFVPFGVKLVPFKVRVQKPRLKIRKPALKIVY